jgi:hypothetical protein
MGKSFVLFVFAEHMPDNLRQLFAHHRTGYMLAASTGYFLVKRLHHRVMRIGNNGRLVEGDPQVSISVFVLTSMAMFPARIFTPRHQPAVAGKLFSRWKPGDVSDLGDHRPCPNLHQPGHGLQPLGSFLERYLLFNFSLNPVDMGL